MTKETLTLQNITQDLKGVLEYNLLNSFEWRIVYIVPIIMVAVLVGTLLKNVLIGGLISLPAIYHLVRYVIEYKEYKIKKQKIIKTIENGNICVSVEKLSHISKEMIYEPHWFNRHIIHFTKQATIFYFMSGSSWRVPEKNLHPLSSKGYNNNWSKQNYISFQGLENISLKNDEFFYISLQGHHDIAYIYPCKFFDFPFVTKKQ